MVETSWVSGADTTDAPDLAAAFAVLSDFLGTTGLTAHLESELVEATAAEAGAVASQSGLTDELLSAALSVRAKVGGLNDVIHAPAIAVALPHILEPGDQEWPGAAFCIAGLAVQLLDAVVNAVFLHARRVPIHHCLILGRIGRRHIPRDHSPCIFVASFQVGGASV